MPGAERGRWPTPEEFTAWYVALEPRHQARFLDHYIEVCRTGTDCYQQNHSGLRREVEYLRNRLSRYRSAWLSAQRRARVHRLRRPRVIHADDVVDWGAIPDGTVVVVEEPAG
jgi:hypothetical protein